MIAQSAYQRSGEGGKVDASLDDFARRLLRQREATALSPSRVAEEFSAHFALSMVPGLAELTALAQRVLGAEVRGSRLEDLRGFHYTLEGGDTTILYEESQWTGAQEHTLLHELYEVLLERLQAIEPSFRAPSGHSLCRLADRFASAVLMQADVFRPFLVASGLDLLAVRHRFRRSYASVLYRAREVLGGEMDFVGALYERRTPGKPEEWPLVPASDDFVATHLTRTAGFPLSPPEARFRPFEYPRHVMPAKNGRVRAGSAVEQVITTGRPLLLERISGFDFWGYSDLTALARPVYWYGRVAKVLLIIVRHGDRGILEPQVQALQPDRIPRSYQTI